MGFDSADHDVNGLGLDVAAELARVRKAASLVSILFAGLYGAFVALADRIHAASPATDPALVNHWMRVWVGEHDGAELNTMFAAVGATLLLAGLLVARIDRVAWFGHWLPQALCAGPALAIVARTHSSNIVPLPGVAENVEIAGLALLVAAAGYWIVRAPRLGRAPKWALGALLFTALAVVVVGAEQPASIFDYGFFIGPALKLSAGEKLGSFYVQYNLLGTYLFRVLMAFELKAHQLQAVLSAIFVVWIALYYRLATRLFEDRFLALSFVFALVVVRFLAVMGGPMQYPQVSVIRMDLWVPLALVLLHFGFRSPITAASFSLVYLADNLFGFFYFGFYGLAFVGSLLAQWRGGKLPALKPLLACAGPMLAVMAFQLLTFGSLLNPARKLYQGVQLGMLPILDNSMFWGALWLMLLAIVPIGRDPKPERRSATLFLYAFAAAQLVYFYGRSHDHNLLNISGVLLLILFVGLDRLRHAGIRALWPALTASVFLALASVAAATPAKEKFDLLRARLQRGVLIEPTDLDREIDQSPKLFAEVAAGKQVVLVSQLDAYLNYRYHLRQVGFFTPVYANVFLEPTADFLRGLVSGNYEVFHCWGDGAEVTDLNASALMTGARQRFVLQPVGRLNRVVLEPASN